MFRFSRQSTAMVRTTLIHSVWPCLTIHHFREWDGMGEMERNDAHVFRHSVRGHF